MVLFWAFLNFWTLFELLDPFVDKIKTCWLSLLHLMQFLPKNNMILSKDIQVWRKHSFVFSPILGYIENTLHPICSSLFGFLGPHNGPVRVLYLWLSKIIMFSNKKYCLQGVDKRISNSCDINMIVANKGEMHPQKVVGFQPTPHTWPPKYDIFLILFMISIWWWLR